MKCLHCKRLLITGDGGEVLYPTTFGQEMWTHIRCFVIGKSDPVGVSVKEHRVLCGSCYREGHRLLDVPPEDRFFTEEQWKDIEAAGVLSGYL